MTECPHCGQPMNMVCGVMFPPKKARILDHIITMTKHGEGRGADIDAMSWIFYPGVAKKDATQRIKVHVGQINDRLQSTVYQVVNTQKKIPSNDKRWRGSTGIIYQLQEVDG